METAFEPKLITPAFVINALNWRYATKIFDRDKKIPEGIFDGLLEVLRLSPSSIGLQPWKFVVVTNPEIRQELKKFSLEQSQLTEASHLIILCSLTEMDEAYIDKVITNEKLLSPDNYSILESYKAFALSYLQPMSNYELRNWIGEQCYIALGFLLSACVISHIDACPIEAIDKKKFNEILNLDKLGVETRTAVALGYRSNADLHAKQKKMRLNKQDIIVTV